MYLTIPNRTFVFYLLSDRAANLAFSPKPCNLFVLNCIIKSLIILGITFSSQVRTRDIVCSFNELMMQVFLIISYFSSYLCLLGIPFQCRPRILSVYLSICIYRIPYGYVSISLVIVLLSSVVQKYDKIVWFYLFWL